MVRLALLCVLWGYLLTAVREKLVDECTEVKDTQCLPCKKGEFLDTWNRERRCHVHRYCDPNLGLQVQKEGTLETDTTCVCEEGRHCTSDACEHCDLHTSCGPGFGVKQLGTGASDTICEPCPDGFFSDVSSAFEKCHPWTSCENKYLVELQAGTNVTDAVCGESSAGPGSSLGRWEPKGETEAQRDTKSGEGEGGVQNRSRALLVIPIIISVLIAILLMAMYFTEFPGMVFRKPKDKALHYKATRQRPVEVTYGDDFLGHNTEAPVQETLHGCQPVTQEDGKESRISVQERQ
ncbi:LOW QUALITY PROTEIN: tumor necrosis factor receptor superfamily member 5 [Erethizon dorsatum]